MLSVSRTTAVVAVCLILFYLHGCSDDDCPTCPIEETPSAANLNVQIIHPQPGPDRYQDIYAAGPNDVFVCASSGAVFRWRGSDWTRYDTGSPYSVRAIWGTSASDVFVVGEQGTIVHFNGSSWNIMPTNILYDLSAVWGTAPYNVYAAGYNGIVLHYDGSQWNEVSTGLAKDNCYLTSLWAIGDNVIVGGYGYVPMYTGIVWRYDGSTWTETLVPESVEALWGFAPDSVFAGGRGGFFWGFDGSAWSAQPSPNCDIQAIWGAAANNLWAAGPHWNGTDWVGGAFNFDGSSWTQSPASFDYYIEALGGVSENEVYLAGDGEQLARYDGSSWSDLNTYFVTSRSLNAVWGTSTSDVWMLGDEGTILHYDGNALTDHSGITDKPIFDAWGAGPNDIYAVGAGGLILKYDGISWTEQAHGLPLDYLHAVWGTSANDVWVGSDGGLFARFDGSSWTEYSISHITNRTITDLWASSLTDYFAVVGNRALHFDGTSWSVLPFDGEYINAVHGLSANLVYFTSGIGRGPIFGKSGPPQQLEAPSGGNYLIIYDGVGYAKVEITFAGQLSLVWAMGANNVFLLGRGSAPTSVLHYNGHAFAQEEIASPYWVDGIWGTGAGTLFAVGDRGLVIRGTVN
jgi:hypothetical protein